MRWPTCRCRSRTGRGPERRWPWPRDRGPGAAGLSGFERGAPRERTGTLQYAARDETALELVHARWYCMVLSPHPFCGGAGCGRTPSSSSSSSEVDGMMETLRRAVRLLVAAVAVSNVVLVNGMFEDQVSSYGPNLNGPPPPSLPLPPSCRCHRRGRRRRRRNHCRRSGPPPPLPTRPPPSPRPSRVCGMACIVGPPTQCHRAPCLDSWYEQKQVGQTDWKLEHIGTPTW